MEGRRAEQLEKINDRQKFRQLDALDYTRIEENYRPGLSFESVFDISAW